MDFGDYELRNYFKLGLKMTSYWAFPEVLPAPKSVESVESMIKRSHSFLKELESKNYENVLYRNISCTSHVETVCLMSRKEK